MLSRSGAVQALFQQLVTAAGPVIVKPVVVGDMRVGVAGIDRRLDVLHRRVLVQRMTDRHGGGIVASPMQGARTTRTLGPTASGSP